MSDYTDSLWMDRDYFIEEEADIKTSSRKGEKMDAVLEAVSPFGVKFGGKETWTNLDKKYKETIPDLKAVYHNGDAVTLDINGGGFITGIKLITAAPPKKAWTGGGGFSKGPADPEKSNKMARGAAVKAVFDSPIVYDMVKDLSEGEALKKALAITQEVADYIEKGA